MTPAEEIKDLLEQQKQVFADFKVENDKRLKEVEKTGAATATTVQNVEALNAKINALQDSLKKAGDRADVMEAAVNRMRLSGGGVGGADSDSVVKNVALFSTMTGRAVTPEQYAQYGPAFNAYLRRGEKAMAPELQNVMQVGSDPDGGYWVTPDTTGRIVKKVYETSPMRQIASVVSIGTDALEGPIDTGEAGSGWVGETEARPETSTPQIGMWRIPVHEQYANPPVTQKLLDDAQFDVEGWLIGKVTDKFTREENKAFVVGDGVKKPRGFLDYTAVTTTDATRPWGTLQYIPTGGAGAFAATNPADAILDLIYSLKAGYRQGAAFVTARAPLGSVRKLKDGNGNYLWQPAATAGQPSRLFDFPVVEAEDMPAIAANAFALAFGNFKEGYQIVDRMGVRVLRDPYTRKPFVLFYTTKRVGGDVLNFEAIKLLKFATT